jgi:hypothetical protein
MQIIYRIHFCTVPSDGVLAHLLRHGRTLPVACFPSAIDRSLSRECAHAHSHHANVDTHMLSWPTNRPHTRALYACATQQKNTHTPTHRVMHACMGGTNECRSIKHTHMHTCTHQTHGKSKKVIAHTHSTIFTLYTCTCKQTHTHTHVQTQTHTLECTHASTLHARTHAHANTRRPPPPTHTLWPGARSQVWSLATGAVVCGVWCVVCSV